MRSLLAVKQYVAVCARDEVQGTRVSSANLICLMGNMRRVQNRATTGIGGYVRYILFEVDSMRGGASSVRGEMC